MRIWDLPTAELCRIHLLGEHRELHAIWTILTTGKKGYLNHPETKRWVGKLGALYARHQDQVAEMEKRNYNHQSDLDQSLATGEVTQTVMINSLDEQRQNLRLKKCECILLWSEPA